ncbi:MAG: hypothetical protein JW818_13185 [Pirellulales bacterium]|nr:hypothetical protein [Pirellulales bacterium]
MTQNDSENKLPIDDDRIFDLLADDELEEERRCSLLSGLDDRPGGWRRCALAFLEVQSWRREFRTLGEKPESETTATDTTASPATAPKRRRRWKKMVRGSTVLGMAASFFLAVGLTSLMRDMQRGGMPSGVGPADYAVIGGPGGSPRAGQPRMIFGMPERPEAVRIVGQDPKGRPTVQILPAFPQEQLDDDFLRGAPSADWANAAEAFRRAGHEARPTRRLVPVQLQDGRRAIFPVDQLDVHYVNGPAYQ